MALRRKEATVIFLVVIMNAGSLLAMRPLERELLLPRDPSFFNSLPQAPSPPLGHSNCTHTPSPGGGGECHNKSRSKPSGRPSVSVP
ncbi:hypothetical protein MRB53_026052 [Persea americana]|uniref:Uncharacterized protein n=1 Tax=Persea americana TaxID=3435 RepID=A0ACC2LH07_PERAE|nr:hypothetical protein MRB53_026052 [Persea americana]